MVESRNNTLGKMYNFSLQKVISDRKWLFLSKTYQIMTFHLYDFSLGIKIFEMRSEQYK